MNNENNLNMSSHGVLGVIELDRPSHLNALSLEMIEALEQQLLIWQDDHAIEAILIRSTSPKAFCAGGDIRYLYDAYLSQDKDYRDYFIAEYKMLNTVRNLSKPVVVFLDGYVLGGGFGLAQACHILVSSEKSRFAMPETGIGFFPDVAATHFLSRLDDIGVYLAVTGEQMSSSDALYLDLIDYHVPSKDLDALFDHLSQQNHLSHAQIEHIIGRFITHPVESEIKAMSKVIHQHFSLNSIAEIEASLASEKDIAYQAWAEKILNILKQRSTIAKQTSLKLQHIGRALSLQQCMQLERDLQDIWFEHGDILEGVRALLIDKDKQPKWQMGNVHLQKVLENLSRSSA